MNNVAGKREFGSHGSLEVMSRVAGSLGQQAGSLAPTGSMGPPLAPGAFEGPAAVSTLTRNETC